MENAVTLSGRLRYDVPRCLARLGVIRMDHGKPREVVYLLMVDTMPFDIIGPEDVAFAFTSLQNFGAPDGAAIVVSGYARKILAERAFLVTRFNEIKTGNRVLWRAQ